MRKFRKIYNRSPKFTKFTTDIQNLQQIFKIYNSFLEFATDFKMTQDLKIACATFGIDPILIDSISIKEFISIYRKKARKVHPDKFVNATEEEKKKKTEECQELNYSYETILKYIVANSTNNSTGENDFDDEKNLWEII